MGFDFDGDQVCERYSKTTDNKLDSWDMSTLETIHNMAFSWSRAFFHSVCFGIQSQTFDLTFRGSTPETCRILLRKKRI